MFTKNTNLLLLLAFITTGLSLQAAGDEKVAADSSTENKSGSDEKYYDIKADRDGALLNVHCKGFRSGFDIGDKRSGSASTEDEVTVYLVVDIQNDPELLKLAENLNKTCETKNCSPSLKAMLMQILGMNKGIKLVEEDKKEEIKLESTSDTRD
jgi:hypothetical protein